MLRLLLSTFTLFLGVFGDLTSPSLTITGPPNCAEPFSHLNHTAQMAFLVKTAVAEEQPFTASVVDASSGKVLSVGWANVSDPLSHGETVAIQNYVNTGQWKPTDALVLYTTAESCPMCAAAEVWTRIDLVVYGSSRPTLVKDGGFGPFSMRAETIFANAAVNNATGYHSVCQIGGVLASQTDPLFVHLLHT